ncbi:amidohydrolase family protein [Caulobacter sp. 17J65-9]|uniref:amidohydrolase family protein n=1 Tax=Caulobacter sp. 17J65-9 TaxID=2709382 RepID=UPI0013CD9B14|nr:amidohydrolase family protein [Caulobacter sp. 17J65-9]NEX91378.1 amidohydrolase family protein [Caulobacter sp. 17J65-9]
MSRLFSAAAAAALIALAANAAKAQDSPNTVAAVPPKGKTCLFNDSHFHLTNYIQEGPPARDVLKIMDGRVCRSALFGIPLQQQWSYRVTAGRAPKYYMDTDAHLYYYSFTDADIAVRYLALSPEERARFDPMITGFNPTDMYAADQIKRVLKTYPGVFVGIGEFSIHKEFVSSKVAGDVASLLDPALDRLLDFAGEVGLLTIMHNDIIMPYSKAEYSPIYFQQLTDALRKHPKTTIIWAHMGLGRVVQPPAEFRAFIESILNDPEMSHVYFDLSWDEVAKYVIKDEQTVKVAAEVINAHPDRFLFGTDVVAPRDAEHYFAVYQMYQPLWDALTPDAREKVLKGNYVRLFDSARTKVRAWEKANLTAP